MPYARFGNPWYVTETRSFFDTGEGHHVCGRYPRPSRSACPREPTLKGRRRGAPDAKLLQPFGQLIDLWPEQLLNGRFDFRDGADQNVPGAPTTKTMTDKKKAAPLTRIASVVTHLPTSSSRVSIRRRANNAVVNPRNAAETKTTKANPSTWGGAVPAAKANFRACRTNS
jgi:hypothetical protein